MTFSSKTINNMKKQQRGEMSTEIAVSSQRIHACFKLHILRSDYEYLNIVQCYCGCWLYPFFEQWKIVISYNQSINFISSTSVSSNKK